MKDGELNFYQELCNVTNKLVKMLNICDIEVVKYINGIILNNGYASQEDIVITLIETNEEYQDKVKQIAEYFERKVMDRR